MNSPQDTHELDALLTRALRPAEGPDAALLDRVERAVQAAVPAARPAATRRPLRTALAAAALVALVATTALATWTWYTLRPDEVAGQLKNRALQAAFQSETAVNINASATSGDYTFTLLAVVSGEDITDSRYVSSSVQPERTYAVVAIAKADGTPMPDPWSDEYAAEEFFASPLVRGVAPWRVNIVTMNGGYQETVVDGVLYRIAECDGVVAFADRGLSFVVSTGVFYSSEAFLYDADTGEVTVNPDFDGAAAVFDLPIDPALADPEQAEVYLEALLGGGTLRADDGEPATGSLQIHQEGIPDYTPPRDDIVLDSSELTPRLQYGVETEGGDGTYYAGGAALQDTPVVEPPTNPPELQPAP